MLSFDTSKNVIRASGIVGGGGNTEIDGFNADDFSAALDQMSGPVELTVRSKGGIVDDGFGIYAAIEDYPDPVNVIVDAMAGSIASVFIMAAESVTMKRYAKLFIHDPVSGIFGNARAFGKMAEYLDGIGNDIAEVYASRSARNGKTRSAAYWRDRMLSEAYLSAIEAVDLGLAENVADAVSAQNLDGQPVALSSIALEGSSAAGARVLAFAMRNRAERAASIDLPETIRKQVNKKT